LIEDPGDGVDGDGWRGDPAHLEVAVAPEPGRTVLRLRGEVDVSSVDLLLEALAEAHGTEHRRVVVDLGEVTFIDLRGMTALYTAGNDGLSISLRSPSRLTRRVIELADMGHVLPIDERAEG
jgi:anti-anti-sigma factor